MIQQQTATYIYSVDV